MVFVLGFRGVVQGLKSVPKVHHRTHENDKNKQDHLVAQITLGGCNLHRQKQTGAQGAGG
jgi:hypothetical protein